MIRFSALWEFSFSLCDFPLYYFVIFVFDLLSFIIWLLISIIRWLSVFLQFFFSNYLVSNLSHLCRFACFLRYFFVFFYFSLPRDPFSLREKAFNSSFTWFGIHAHSAISHHILRIQDMQLRFFSNSKWFRGFSALLQIGFIIEQFWIDYIVKSLLFYQIFWNISNFTKSQWLYSKRLSDVKAN